MNSQNKHSQNTQKQNKWFIIVMAVIFMALGITAWTYMKGSNLAELETSLTSTYFAQGRPVNNIDMLDHNEQAFTGDQFKGKWTFVFFGFTHCPDICPTALLIMKTVWQDLLQATAVDGAKMQFIFVSVDPDRDTPAILKDYVQYYHKDFIAITAEHDKLDVLTNQLYAVYGYEDTSESDANAYSVNHTDKLFLIDPNGTYRAYFSSPYPPDLILAEFKIIQSLYKRDNKVNLEISMARIISAPPQAQVLAGYMTLTNKSDEVVEIIGVSSHMFKLVEMHQSSSVEGMAKMIKQETLRIEVGSSVLFQQGGLHLMLIGPKTQYNIGDEVIIDFKTSAGTIISTPFVVEEASLDQMHDHSAHH